MACWVVGGYDAPVAAHRLERLDVATSASLHTALKACAAAGRPQANSFNKRSAASQKQAYAFDVELGRSNVGRLSSETSKGRKYGKVAISPPDQQASEAGWVRRLNSK